jgi:hypothetical protein
VKKIPHHFKQYFIIRVLKQQLQCLNTEKANGFRWDPSILAWAASINYHGGSGVISIIQGKVSLVK